MSEKLCALRKIGGGTNVLDSCQVVGIKYDNMTPINKTYTLATSFTIGSGGFCDGYLIECSKATRFRIDGTNGISVLGIKGNTASVVAKTNTGAKDVSIDCDYLLITGLSTGGTLGTYTVTLS